MSTSRKRYRPLDSAEERAIHVNQRVQVLPLENEQSYCFSWPEASLTLWLRENRPYAALYQLAVSSSSGLGSSGSNIAHAAGVPEGSSGSFTAPSSEAAEGKTRCSSLLTASTRSGLATNSLMKSAATMSAQGRRVVELPPVYLMSEGDRASHAVARPFTEGAGGEDNTEEEKEARAAGYGERGDEGVRDLLRRLRRAMDLERSIPATISKSDGIRSSVASGVAPSASLGSSPFIVMPTDAVPASPHPLAPPRPQSCTEDSIFSLSAVQLADLEMAGVASFFAPGGSAELTETFWSTAEAGDDTPAHSVRCDVGTGGQGRRLSEAARREIEQEVVGLEWRTWSQSQRTAAALQRLLSLEAAVPFEPSGEANRDGWRAVVHQLWLQWRQQFSTRPPFAETASTTALSNLYAKPHSFMVSSAGDPHSASPIRSSSSTVRASPQSSPMATLVRPQYPQLTHYSWGAPLLSGAYLTGTSNDYFISFPPQGANASAQGGSGIASSGSAQSTSLWSATSRRRGAYGFLRWKLELYEAQMPSAVGEDDEEASFEESESEVNITGSDDSGAEGDGEDRSEKVRKHRRFSKGPLSSIHVDQSVSLRRNRRGGGRDSTTDGDGVVTRRNPMSAHSIYHEAPLMHHHPINGVMSTAHVKRLIRTTVLTQPLTELEVDDESTTIMERLACSDLRHDTDAWRVWLSKV